MLLNSFKVRTFVFLLSTIFFTGCGTDQSTTEKSAVADDSIPAESTSDNVEKPIILFFGNSITAGYQLDVEEAFPALIQKRLDSLGFQYNVINAGLSGETTASGVSRIDWVLRSVPDIFVLELGANDGLRGLPLTESVTNLQTIIDKVRQVNSEVTILIAGMQVPPNLGDDYTKEFREVFTKVAEENDAVLIPFLLDGVAGIPELNLSDGIHPTAEGHQVLASTVWRYLSKVLVKEDT